ncbi:MAG: hypothetical protein WCP34_09930 [Pseudomonadota bacterium]
MTNQAIEHRVHVSTLRDFTLVAFSLPISCRLSPHDKARYYTIRKKPEENPIREEDPVFYIKPDEEKPLRKIQFHVG